MRLVLLIRAWFSPCHIKMASMHTHGLMHIIRSTEYEKTSVTKLALKFGGKGWIQLRRFLTKIRKEKRGIRLK